MKVILLRDVPKVGRSGDIVNVADGFARNYLFPRELATMAQGGALREVQSRLAREKEMETQQLAQARENAEKLKNATISISGKVGTGTKLYGSITAADVAGVIEREFQIKIDRRRIDLIDPIKSTGNFPLRIKLHSEEIVPITLEVISEAEAASRAKEPAPVAATIVEEPAVEESTDTQPVG